MRVVTNLSCEVGALVPTDAFLALSFDLAQADSRPIEVQPADGRGLVVPDTTTLQRMRRPNGAVAPLVTATTTDMFEERDVTALATTDRVGAASIDSRFGRAVQRHLPRREPSADARRAALLMADARTDRASRDVYELFERVTTLILRSDAEDILAPVAGYLRDPMAPHRSVLLSCLADHDVEITDRRTLAVVARLCSSSDMDLARAAAAALEAGGALAHTVLENTLSRLPEARRSEFARFLVFASTG